MTEQELIKHVADEPFNFAVGQYNNIDGYYMCWLPEPDDVIHISKAALPDLDWPEIRKACINGRDVKHFTRIVGYFSNIDNWNKSKIGELKDRHRGNYRVGL